MDSFDLTSPVGAICWGARQRLLDALRSYQVGASVLVMGGPLGVRVIALREGQELEPQGLLPFFSESPWAVKGVREASLVTIHIRVRGLPGFTAVYDAQTGMPMHGEVVLPDDPTVTFPNQELWP